MRHSYLDNYSNLNSLIHNIDPRIKIISFITFIFFVISTNAQSYSTFLYYGILITLLILESRVPLWFVFRRSLAVLPFVILIAIFIPFYKEGEVVARYSFVKITREGLILFWNVIIKSYLSLLSMILLMASIKFSSFLKALQQLKIPKLFVMILSFMYRYIFVLEDELMKMKQAKDARSISPSRWLDLKSLANMIGVLFLRAYERGENVYLAMCSRGFDGTVRTAESSVLRQRDFVFLFFMFSILTTIKIFGA